MTPNTYTPVTLASDLLDRLGNHPAFGQVEFDSSGLVTVRSRTGEVLMVTTGEPTPVGRATVWLNLVEAFAHQH